VKTKSIGNLPLHDFVDFVAEPVGSTISSTTTTITNTTTTAPTMTELVLISSGAGLTTVDCCIGLKSASLDHPSEVFSADFNFLPQLHTTGTSMTHVPQDEANKIVLPRRRNFDHVGYFCDRSELELIPKAGEAHFL